jgi:DNA-binding response OmpR family regulator
MNDNKKKVLIVEDEPTLMSVLSDRLLREGFEVSLAKNGQEGLEKIGSDKPDLVLLDLLMPVMDGITVLNKLKDKDGKLPVKVIVLTNLNDDKEVAKALENGATDYLVKADWKIKDVVIKIRKQLNIEY